MSMCVLLSSATTYLRHTKPKLSYQFISSYLFFFFFFLFLCYSIHLSIPSLANPSASRVVRGQH
ncbi:unnamed protein product [Periconia digitata]|uniref:Uncharacterized protein n=1 Tax=Periconia digitata TaxID=1303443 RepID=A0A9W4UQM2_9PLEO|nr:unnamed protein product [Periconia digitata]